MAAAAADSESHLGCYLHIDGAAAIWANSLLQNKHLDKLDFTF